MTLPNFKAIELPKRSVKYFMIIAGLVDKQTDFQPIEYSKIRKSLNITEDDFERNVLDIGALCTIDEDEFDIIYDNWNNESQKNNACLILSNFLKNFDTQPHIGKKGWEISFNSKNEPILKDSTNNEYYKINDFFELSKEQMINFRSDGFYLEYIPSHLRYKIPVAIKLLNKATKQEQIRVFQLEYSEVENYLALKTNKDINRRLHNHLYFLFHYGITKPVPEWTEESKYELLDLWPISHTDYNDYLPRKS